MQKELTARPTEYRGIQYRSKCEAMFAMWLHLRNSDDVLIEYEPEWAVNGDYVADFAIHRPAWSDDRIAVAVTCIEVIEYKPSMPTITYCDDVMKKLKELADKELVEIADVGEITLSIYFGSVYTNDRGRICFDGGSSYTINRTNWLTIYEKQIRDHRFDLESEA